MNVLLEKLKKDTMSGIFDVAGKSWLPPTVGFILCAAIMIIALVATMPIFALALEPFINDIQDLVTSPENSFEKIGRFDALFYEIEQSFTPLLYGAAVLLYLFYTFLISWLIYVAILAGNEVINGRKAKLGVVFAKSFSGQLFKVFLVNLVTVAISFIFSYMIEFLVNQLGGGSFAAFLSIIFQLLLMAFLFKFYIAFAILTYQNMGVGDALKESFESFTFSKGIKYALFTLIGIVVLMVIVVIFMLTFTTLARMEEFGLIIAFLMVSALAGIVIAMFGSLVLSMYYKYYSKAQEGTDEIEDHLIYNN